MEKVYTATPSEPSRTNVKKQGVSLGSSKLTITPSYTETNSEMSVGSRNTWNIYRVS